MSDKAYDECAVVGTPYTLVCCAVLYHGAQRASVFSGATMPGDFDFTDEPSPPPKKTRSRERDEEDDLPSRRPRESGRGFRCPYCESTKLPRVTKQMSQSSQTWLIVLILFCFPLFWIPLMWKEDVRKCVDCGMKLG